MTRSSFLTCLSSQYLATWIIARGGSVGDAAAAMHYVAPVGEKVEYVERARAVVSPYLPPVASVA